MPVITAEQIEATKAALAKGPEPHPSVSHVKLSVESFVEAAQFQRSNGELLTALQIISVAEGIAMALEAVAGVVEGRREHKVKCEVGALRIAIQLEAIRAYKS